MPPATAPKKSGNGCLIALAIVGGLVVLVVGLAAFGVYRFANTREGKAMFGLVGGMTRLMARAAAAPGTGEVRALGCDVALAIDMERMHEILQELDGADASAPSEIGTMVLCQVRSGTAPTCDEVAKTYLAAAGPPRRELAVSVTRGSNEPVCQSLYEPNGTKLKDLSPGSTPTFPTGE